MAIYQNYCSRVVKIRSGWLSNQMPYRRPDDRANDRELVRFRMRYSEIKLWVTHECAHVCLVLHLVHCGVPLVTITSALDKEWMIDGRGINNSVMF